MGREEVEGDADNLGAGMLALTVAEGDDTCVHKLDCSLTNELKSSQFERIDSKQVTQDLSAA